MNNKKKTEQPQLDIIEGVVSNCESLRIRAEASTKSDIICVVNAGATVLVDLKESTNDFYKVVTEVGAEGFAMSEFIVI